MAETHNSPVADKKDFFISYTGADLQWAHWIDAQLKAAGYTTVVQCADFVASGDFLTDMDKAVRECHRLMPVFSPAHFRSPFCRLERNSYLALDPDGSKHLILPVVVEACEDLGLFRSRTHVDVTKADEIAAREKLLAAVKTGLPPSGPAVFPGNPASSPSPVVFPRTPLPPNNLSIAGIVENEGYVPRAAQMAALEAALASGAAVALTQALRGDGGFGKTEIAKAFLYAHAREFAGLWWVDASAAGHALATDRLAEKLGINFPPDIDRDQLRRAICETLSQARHLLVLDNVDDPAVLGAWPVQQPAVRLVTTRLHGAAIKKLHPVEVSELTPDEARSLLRQHRDDLAGPEHEAALETIAAELGHHALAVALAGAWLANHPTRTPADLLAGLQTESHKISREVLQEMNPQDALGERYARGVFATLTLHLGELQNPWSRTVLEIAAFLHPGGIPLELLPVFSKDWPLRAPDSEVAAHDFDSQLDRVKEAIEELHGRSLLALDDGAAGLHRLAQRAIRAGMTSESRNAALRHGLIGLTGLLADAVDPIKLAQHAPLIPHAAAALGLAGDAALDSEAGILAVKVANYFQNRAEFAGALAALELAETHLRVAFGSENEQIAIMISNRGEIFRAMGDLDKSLCCIDEAERIFQIACGDDHLNVAKGINNRGGILKSIGDLDKALQCFTEAERIARKLLGDEAPEVATFVNNRGGVFMEKGDLDGALRCYEEAECIDRKAFGDNHPNVANRINNRGGVLWTKGELDGALSCFNEAERIDRMAFGDDHTSVAKCINNRGNVLQAKKDLNGARACYREAFFICLRKLGPRAGNTLTGANNLLAVGDDPFALAREIAGEEVAADLERYFREWAEKRS